MTLSDQLGQPCRLLCVARCKTSEVNNVQLHKMATCNSNFRHALPDSRYFGRVYALSHKVDACQISAKSGKQVCQNREHKKKLKLHKFETFNSNFEKPLLSDMHYPTPDI